MCCCVVLCCVVLRCVVLCCAALCCVVVLCCVVLLCCCVVLCCVVHGSTHWVLCQLVKVNKSDQWPGTKDLVTYDNQ